MPAPETRTPKLPRELFETRTHAWQSLGLGEEIETPKVSEALAGRPRGRDPGADRDPGRLLPPAPDRPRLRRMVPDRHRDRPGDRRQRRDPLALARLCSRASTAASTRRRRGRSASSSACWRRSAVVVAGAADRRRQRRHPRGRRRLHRGRSSASPPSRASARSSPASSCRAPGPSGSANGCASSAAPWPARWRGR